MGARRRANFHLAPVLLPGGWTDDVRIEDVDGSVSQVFTDQLAKADDERIVGRGGQTSRGRIEEWYRHMLLEVVG